MAVSENPFVAVGAPGDPVYQEYSCYVRVDDDAAYVNRDKLLEILRDAAERASNEAVTHPEPTEVQLDDQPADTSNNDRADDADQLS